MEPIALSGFEESIHRFVRYVLGKRFKDATKRDLFNAVSSAVRMLLIDIAMDTEKRYEQSDAKRMHYLSIEFLPGRLLSNNLINLGIQERCREILKNMGVDLDELMEHEPDPALGNGGLGRLAACFLDSLATLDMPGFGYGINYDYGLFKQSIMGGEQRENPDFWPNRSSPWLLARSGERCMVPVYGRIEVSEDMDGEYNPMWVDWKLIIGRAHDIPVAGFGGRTVNRLRLFSAWAGENFDMQVFNEGDYFRAVEEKIQFESISKILYPSDSQEAGRELRLVQEYFLVACSVHDILRFYLKHHDGFDQFPDKVAIQLNDTHPALTVAELMRVFVDGHGLEWDRAWEITTRTLGYTNHTLLPEALETWPVSIVERVIPRHLQIIYEINRRFVALVKKRFPDDPGMVESMAIIREGEEKLVRMANLAIIGSHSVNGVAAIHSELVKTRLVPDFYRLWPHRFNNKTNGVTPRRWLLAANPGLAGLVTDAIGDGWIKDLEQLKGLEPLVRDGGFLDRFSQVKRANKLRLAAIIKKTTYVDVDPDSIFDIHAKRIHEYKRQLLNLLNIVHIYFEIKEDNRIPASPRTFIFAGKAAPGYVNAKLVIRLIHGIADVVNSDPDVNQWLRVVFIPDYRVSLAEAIIPAADVSEQISCAGMEASGTGNMKFALNGALTLGTLDGANIEIADRVGEENIYIFGLTVEEVDTMRNHYNPWDYIDNNPGLGRVMNAINSDLFCKKEPGIFGRLYDSIVNQGDYYFNMADFYSYVEIQKRVGINYQEHVGWAKKSLLNTARIGYFSSDRAIREYAREIWNIQTLVRGKC
jgi:starch phosphorylase